MFIGVLDDPEWCADMDVTQLHQRAQCLFEQSCSLHTITPPAIPSTPDPPPAHAHARMPDDNGSDPQTHDLTTCREICLRLDDIS